MDRKTQRLEHLSGQDIRVNHNIAIDSAKFAFSFLGNLRVYKTHYEIMVTGGTWIHFTDDDISYVDDNYIELNQGV